MTSMRDALKVEPGESNRLKANGNLSYLQFIRILEKLWRDRSPDIPIFAMGGEQYAKYPCIVYGLQTRQTIDTEPKPRYREQIVPTDGDPVVVSAQRFDNIVLFSAVTESDPLLCEELIESFEDFLQEYTPVFKALGLSEMLYSRRLPDSEENRPGQGVVKRTLAYLVRTEKIIISRQKKLESIVIDVRLWVDDYGATPNSATPSSF